LSYNLKQGDTYALIELDLSSARDNYPIFCPGDIISVLEINGEVTVRLDKRDAPEIDLTKVSKVNVRPMKFSWLYFSNPAQSGKRVILLIGREASFEPIPSRIGNVGLLDVAETRINPATEDTLAKLLNSIGDAGESPTNTSGTTLLRWSELIQDRCHKVSLAVSGWIDNEKLTDTPLLGNAIFTSATYDMHYVHAGYVFASAHADVDGVLAIEQSWDGANWDFRDEQSLTGPGSAYLKAPLKARYVRIVYENGATDQSEFRLGMGVVIA